MFNAYFDIYLTLLITMNMAVTFVIIATTALKSNSDS